jgi:transglutaminase-like putative cysteine protease
MSGVATTTLWITEQLPFWVIAIQLVAFATSYATRLDPPAFRRSPIWLNIGMIGVTSITIRTALAGNPATVSLAYFTALAQGLQLLDARPRHSEFVLVALGLFQVVLASNLTDSILFPPLLLVFLASVTWTLMIHTLRMEAAESGDVRAGAELHAPELRRMTIVATSACLVLALLLFVLLPRFRSHLIEGGSRGGVALSGFSDRVSLGDVGRIRSDPTVVLRVESLDRALPVPAEAYWRGLAFDAFDGRQWSISSSERIAARRPISGVGRFGIELSRNSDAPRRAQQILREPVDSGVVFAPGRVERIEGPFQRLETDRNGGLYMPGRSDERVRYTVWSAASEADPAELRNDRARPPLEMRAGGTHPAERYLALPPLDPRIEPRAAEMIAGATTDFDRARQIEQALRRQGRYTDSPRVVVGEGLRSPVEAFILGDLEGHCEYFASAMVLLARTQGLPSRLVNGFAGGVPNPVGGFLEVTRADAHAWVEIHFEQAGWVRFDPTPPSLRLRSAGDLSLWDRGLQLGSAIELWWFQRVVDFDSADQIGVLRGLWMRWRSETRSEAEEAPSPPSQAAEGSGRSPFNGLPDPILVLTGLIGMGGLLAWIRRERARSVVRVPATYRRAQRLLARRGWVRAKSVSARDFARSLHGALPPPAIRAFDRITESYLAERFGSRPAENLDEALEVLADAVDRMGLRNQSHV